jgi:hypothetical protein
LIPAPRADENRFIWKITGAGNQRGDHPHMLPRPLSTPGAAQRTHIGMIGTVDTHQ